MKLFHRFFSKPNVQGRNPNECARGLGFEILQQSVDSLILNTTGVVYGVFALSVIAGFVAWRSHVAALAPVILLLWGLTVIRVALAFIYWRNKPNLTAIEHVRPWERALSSVATVTAICVSSTMPIVYFASENPVDRCLLTIFVYGWLACLGAQNFSHPNLVRTQTLIQSVIIVSALIYAGGEYLLLFPFGLMPIVFASTRLAARLHAILIRVVKTAHDNASLVDRFDLAINAMPHGLCMFDENGRLIVASDASSGLLGLTFCPLNDALEDLLAASRAAGRLADAQCEAILNERRRALNMRENRQLFLDLADGVCLSLRFQIMKTGGYVLLIEDATEQRRKEVEIMTIARTDPLTNLPNRGGFQEYLENAFGAMEKHGDQLALVFLDIDNFKEINDTHGHAYGDALLVAVARRLRECAPNAVVGRQGGDEFVVLLAGQHIEHDAEMTAARLVKTLSQPYRLIDRMVRSSASIGLAIAPKDANTPHGLMKQADLALYAAKRSGRNVWAKYHSDPLLDNPCPNCNECAA